MPVRLKSAASRSQVKPFTTEPLRSLNTVQASWQTVWLSVAPDQPASKEAG